MSEVKVNKISPRSGTTVTLGDSGDTFTLASGVSLTGVNATFSGDLTVDTDTLYVDSTNNRVGIGTASPDRELTVGSVANARIGILSSDNSLGASQLQFGDTDNSQVGRIYYEHSDDTMRFHTGNVERARISSSGFHIGGTTSANALDDYETGTWTPTADSGLSGFTIAKAKYTKIGNLVTATAYLSPLTGKTGSSLIIGGLPFTTSAGLFQPAVCDLQTKMRWIRSNESNDNLSFYNDDRTAVVGTDVGSHIILNITYQIA